MKKILTVASAALLLAACTEKPGYTITGKVNNAELNGKYVYLYEYGSNDAAPIDSALVENGAFTLKGTQNTTSLRTIRFSENDVEPRRAASGETSPFTALLALQNSAINVVLDEKYSDVSGTPENDAMLSFQKEIRALREEQKKLEANLKSQEAEVKRAAETKYDEFDHQIAEKAYSYIKQNINNLTSAKLLVDFRYELNEEQQNDIVANASEEFKNVSGVQKLIDHLEVLKKVAVGQKFTDFEMADIKGKTHKLSEFVGNGKNIVLIDFWASWCPPCRRDMPNLVDTYKEFKGKGFEIVGISLDSKKEAWEKGIKDLNITWTQLSDLKGWKNDGAALYGVNSIPHTILVDKDGTIIAKGLHGKEVAEKLKELLK
ncbi:MAG: TlpA disulfide reductase family protein [Parabacteroides sp.]|nr:TlpA disulfide reductase family protein [Parabacteroides sp.]